MELATSNAKQAADADWELFWSSDSTQRYMACVLRVNRIFLSPHWGLPIRLPSSIRTTEEITPEFKHLGGALRSPDSRRIAFTALKHQIKTCKSIWSRPLAANYSLQVPNEVSLIR